MPVVGDEQGEHPFFACRRKQFERDPAVWIFQRVADQVADNLGECFPVQAGLERQFRQFGREILVFLFESRAERMQDRFQPEDDIGRDIVQFEPSAFRLAEVQ